MLGRAKRGDEDGLTHALSQVFALLARRFATDNHDNELSDNPVRAASAAARLLFQILWAHSAMRRPDAAGAVSSSRISHRSTWFSSSSMALSIALA